MVGVITLNLQKKCILVAKKGCNLQWQISYDLLFFEKNYLFLVQFFLFSIWTAKTSLRLVLTTIQISKKKELIAEKKKFLSEKKLRMQALPFQCNAFPATKKIYALQIHFFYLSSAETPTKSLWNDNFENLENMARSKISQNLKTIINMY